MIIRNQGLDDVQEILSFHREDFQLPSIHNPNYVIRDVFVDESGTVIGAGWVKLTTETMITFHPEVSAFERARCIKQYFQSVYDRLEQMGIDDTHLFVKDNHDFVTFLCRHFDMQMVDSEAIYWQRGVKVSNGQISNTTGDSEG